MPARYSPPCITARRGGCVIKKISRSHRSRRSRGGFPFCSQSEKPPRLRYQWMLRDIFLFARPPLLAVMQGGECRSPETHSANTSAPTVTEFPVLQHPFGVRFLNIRRSASLIASTSVAAGANRIRRCNDAASRFRNIRCIDIYGRVANPISFFIQPGQRLRKKGRLWV